MEKIKREEYFDKLLAFKDKQVIKIVTGVRRCGKSTLLQMFREYLLKEGVSQEQIISVNFEDFEYYELRNPRNLYSYVKERLTDKGQNYLFFDEIQHVKDFPDVLNSLFIKDNTDIYVTGSNAYMLSSEIATLISGRYVEIAMLPLSFREYVSARGRENGLQKLYAEYTGNGAFPYVLEFGGNRQLTADYLSGVYDTIVLKDVLMRNKISDPMMLESIIRFTFDNIGNILSTKRIADSMAASGRKIDVKTVEKYLSALSESFIIYKAGRYNIKGRQLLKTLEKYYVVDIGLRNMLLGSRSFDVGHILENVVYLELLRRGNKVYVGHMGDREVDFVAVGRRGIAYYQVSATVRDETTLSRELAPLQTLTDQYPKVLLTLDDDPEADYEGIRRMNVLSWLMHEDYLG